MGKSTKINNINAPHLENEGQFPKLRANSIGKGIQSREEASRHTRHFKKTHPKSQYPHLGEARHKYNTPTKAVIETTEGFFQTADFTPVKHDAVNNTFISPGGHPYIADRRVSRTTPGGTTHVATSLRRERPDRARKAALINTFSTPDVQGEVILNYNHLSKPQGMEKRINNNAIQKGSAKEKFEAQKAELRDYLETQHIDRENIDDFLSTLEASRFEHTHHLSAHFGHVLDTEGRTIDPRSTKATSPMPAGFNSEMMLLEKLTDYLLFTNRHTHRFDKKQDSVKFAYSGGYVPGTRLFAWFELEVTDLRTGVTYKESWCNPLSSTAKPSMVGYERLLQSMKNDKPFIPVETMGDHPQGSSQPEADHGEKDPTQPLKRQRHK